MSSSASSSDFPQSAGLSDWLVEGGGGGGGRKRPSNRCGTKEQQALYLFSLQPTLICLPLPLPTLHILRLHSLFPLWGFWQCNERAETQPHGVCKRKSGFSSSGRPLLLCLGIQAAKMWMNGCDWGGGLKLHVIYCSWHSNMTPRMQRLTCVHLYAGTHTHTHTGQWLAAQFKESSIDFWLMWRLLEILPHVGFTAHYCCSTDSDCTHCTHREQKSKGWCVTGLKQLVVSL